MIFNKYAFLIEVALFKYLGGAFQDWVHFFDQGGAFANIKVIFKDRGYFLI